MNHAHLRLRSLHNHVSIRRHLLAPTFFLVSQINVSLGMYWVITGYIPTFSNDCMCILLALQSPNLCRTCGWQEDKSGMGSLCLQQLEILLRINFTFDGYYGFPRITALVTASLVTASDLEVIPNAYTALLGISWPNRGWVWLIQWNLLGLGLLGDSSRPYRFVTKTCQQGFLSNIDYIEHSL